MLTELIERRWIVASGTLAEGGEVRLTELGGSFMANDPCLALAKALERLDRPTIAELSDILEVVFDEVCGVQTESGAGIRRKFLS